MLVYAKALVAIAGSLITVLLGVVPPSNSLFTILTAIAGFLTAAGVYAIPNKPAVVAPPYTPVVPPAVPPAV